MAVTIDSGVKYFVTDASLGADGGLGEATIEVFKTESGRQWSERFTLTPGDILGGPERVKGRDGVIDFTTDFYLVDVVATPSPSSMEEDDSSGIGVLIQRIGDDGWECRFPDVDEKSIERKLLANEVKQAESASSSSQGAPPTEG